MKENRETSPLLKNQTKGVETLLGNPRKAIIKLSLPMIIALSVHTLYTFIDALWVSGLGADALSAVGFFFPFLFMILALATGIGVGGGSAISRRIGANDKTGADLVGTHTFVLMIITAFAITTPLFLSASSIFTAMGAGPVASMAASYARILFAGTVIFFFSNIASAIMRAEGDVKRAMYAMMLGAGLNIILDPIFIYVFDLGVSGAAWATMLSLCMSSAFLFRWLFIKKVTFINISFRKFRFKKNILKDIYRVGLPASVQQLAMAFSMFLLNLIAVKVGGTDGVAVYTTGWRVAMFAILPLLGIATAVTSVTGAAFGARNYEKLNLAYMYAIKIGLVIELGVGLLTFIFAPQIAGLFTMAEETVRIRADLIIFLRLMCIYYPTTAFGMLSSSMFQGTGKGMYSLIATLIRTIVLAAPLAYVFAVFLDLRLKGVWWGIVTGNVLAGFIAFIWGRFFIHRLFKTARN
ncbi:MATE family efflux transporter [Acidobacteriota bacterium]